MYPAGYHRYSTLSLRLPTPRLHYNTLIRTSLSKILVWGSNQRYLLAILIAPVPILARTRILLLLPGVTLTTSSTAGGATVVSAATMVVAVATRLLLTGFQDDSRC